GRGACAKAAGVDEGRRRRRDRDRGDRRAAQSDRRGAPKGDPHLRSPGPIEGGNGIMGWERIVSPEVGEVEDGLWSNCIRAGDFLFVSGQVARSTTAGNTGGEIV